MTEIELTQYYADLLDFARSVCRPDEAEEIASDTILSTLEDIRAGKSIENPAGYLRTVFSRRKNDRLRAKYRESIVEFDDGSRLSRIPERREIDRSGEEYRRVRRELSRLGELYREITVRHYMKGEKLESIAESLGIPLGTVKRRLGSAREVLREELKMEEKYSELSYSPKRLALGIWGAAGARGEPFFVNESLIAQNLLIAAYEKPLSVCALGDSLGIPAAYVEFEAKRLVDGELMGRTSGGLLYSRIFIYQNGEQYGDIERQRDVASRLVRPIFELISRSLGALTELPECAKLNPKQRATLALHFLMNASMVARYLYDDVDLPERPNCGKWLASGRIYEPGVDESDPYHLSGPASAAIGTRTICDLQSKLGETHWSYMGGLKYPISLVLMRDFLASLRDSSVKPSDERIYELIPSLEELRILRRNERGEVEPDVPVIPYGEYKRLSDALGSVQSELDALLKPETLMLVEQCERKIPAHIDGRESYRSFGAVGALLPEMLLAAIEQGLVEAKIGETPIMVVTY